MYLPAFFNLSTQPFVCELFGGMIVYNSILSKLLISWQKIVSLRIVLSSDELRDKIMQTNDLKTIKFKPSVLSF